MGLTISVAGRPPRGRGFYTELCEDGRALVALGCGTQTGFELDYELADQALPGLATTAAAGNEEEGYQAAVEVLQALVAAHGDHDEGLPMLTTIVASCGADSIDLSWVGDDKAYLLRRGAIVAETREHTHWRDALDGKVRADWAPLVAKIDPSQPWAVDGSWPHARTFRRMLGIATRTITAEGCIPERIRFAVEPGDALLLVSNSLHCLIGWRAGIERVLTRVVALEVDVVLAEARALAASIEPQTRPLEWAGPIVLVRW